MDFPAKGYKDLKENCPDIPADTCPLIDKTLKHVTEIEVNLEKQFVKSSKSYSFEIDEFKKSSLLNGLDEIGLTLENKSVIANFEKSYFSNYPWLKQE